MAGVAADSAKSAKNLAKQVARQMAGEPSEILKAAGRQVGAVEKALPPREGAAVSPKDVSPEEKAKIESQGLRQLAALEREIEDIKRKKQHQEAAKVQEEQALIAQKEEEKGEAPKVPSKPSRRFFGFGKKAQAEKQKTRVERPLPPSG